MPCLFPLLYFVLRPCHNMNCNHAVKSPDLLTTGTSPSAKQPAPPPASEFFFYQAADGQCVFLHPLVSRALLAHYGSYPACPSEVLVLAHMAHITNLLGPCVSFCIPWLPNQRRQTWRQAHCYNAASCMVWHAADLFCVWRILARTVCG